MSTSTAITGIINQYSGGDYDSLTTGQKIEVFKNISSITYKTIITDLLAGIKTLGWDAFYVSPTEFGNGYRVLTAGNGVAEDFSDNPTQRFPSTRNLLSDYEALITDRAQLRTRITVNEAESSFYFKNAEGLGQYLEMCRRRIYDTFLQVFQDTMIRMFGSESWPIKNCVDADNYLALIDTVKGNIKNSISVTATDLKDQVTFLLKFVEFVTSLTTDQFNIGDDGSDDTFVPAFNNVREKDLVLIMSSWDSIDFTTQTAANTYHKELFKWPNVTIMQLPIPSGTFYLLDKNAIQISPNRNATYTDFYPNTLDTDLFHHMWFYMGIYKYAFGLKINFVTSGGKSMSDIFTEMQERYTPTTTTTTTSKSKSK